MGDEDKFNISNGNLEVLRKIPEMMTQKKWRKELRRLVIDYLFQKKIDIRNDDKNKRVYSRLLL